MKVKSESEVAQSGPTLSDPTDCSLPGSSTHGIFQARVLEWGAIASSVSLLTYRFIKTEFKWSVFICSGKPKHYFFYSSKQCMHMFILEYITLYCTCFSEGNGNPLQYSCLEYPMDGGVWWASVHGVTKSRTGLSDFTLTSHFHALEKEMATHSSVLAWRIPGTGSLVGCRLWGRTESDTTEVTQQQQLQDTVDILTG